MTKQTSLSGYNVRKAQAVSIAAIVVILLATSFYFRFQYTVAQSKLDQYEKTYAIHASSVGDILDTKAFSFAVTKVEYDETGIRELPVTPGMKFVMVSVSIYNKTGASISFLPVLETYMRDASGARYEISTAPKIETPSIAGTIERAKGYSGTLGFMVPKDSKDLEFIYEPKAFPNSNTIIYGINK